MSALHRFHSLVIIRERDLDLLRHLFLLSLSWQITSGIDPVAVDTHLEVEVRAGGAGHGDHGPGRHRSAHRYHFLKPATVREGVKWLPEKQLDVFFVTLNKADKDYSPTTMYHDYSINENLFHWQSQSTTAADSPTGQRYIHHRERGSKVLLFVREFKADRITGGAEAYTFLGTANYVRYEGSKPMNITWNLDRPIPAKFLKKTNKLVVG